MIVGRLVHELLNDKPSTGLNGTITEQCDIWPFLSEPYIQVGTSLSSSVDNAQNSGAWESSDLSERSDASSELTSPSVGSHLAAPAVLAYGSTQQDNKELSASAPAGFSSASQASHTFALPTVPTTRPSILGPRLLIPSRGPLAGINSPDSPASPVTRVVDLTQQIKTLSNDAFTHGGFADIYWGEWEHRSEDGPTKTIFVAIKLLRVLAKKDVDGVRARKRLNRELYVWHRLDHPNIAKMFGTSYHMGGRPAMVLEWYQNGNASEYLKKNHTADRKMLIHDIARGLNYLHTLSPPIVHGDLKGNNVLITDGCRGVLTDFGLSQVIEDLIGPTGNTTSTAQGAVRWMAPELMLDDSQTLRLTFSSDVWSFGCTAYELLTGKLPYHNRPRDCLVIRDIVDGVKPGAPDTSPIDAPEPPEKIWPLLNRCWSDLPRMRPQMKEVDTGLEEM